MKKFFSSLALVVALSAASSAFAGTIERDSDGNLEINVFANIIESFRISISGADLQEAGAAPTALGFIDLNGTLAGYDALQSIAAPAGCKDDLGVAPTFAGTTACAVVVGPLMSASDSKLVFDLSLAVKAEISGTAKVDLAASMLGISQADAVFSAQTVQFQTALSSSIVGMEDQDTDTLVWHGEAALNGGPGYDDTIVVSVLKQVPAAPAP